MMPWAFVGFEAVSHSSAEFGFSSKKLWRVLAAAIVASLAMYAMLAEARKSRSTQKAPAVKSSIQISGVRASIRRSAWRGRLMEKVRNSAITAGSADFWYNITLMDEEGELTSDGTACFR